MVFIELCMEKMACIFEIITTHCAELDRCSVVFGFPFFSLLLALHYSGSSFLRLESLAPSSDILPHLFIGNGCAIYNIMLNGVLPP